MKQQLVLIAIIMLLVGVLVWAIDSRGRAAARADRADSTALARSAEARALERARQLADSARLAAEAQLAQALEAHRRSTAAARRRTDSVIAVYTDISRHSEVADSGLPDPAHLEAIAGAVLQERAACDATLAVCAQLRAAAELRAREADASARRLDSSVVTLQERLAAAIARRPGALRRAAEVGALAGCAIAGATAGAGQLGIATLVGGTACLLELVF